MIRKKQIYTLIGLALVIVWVSLEIVNIQKDKTIKRYFTAD